MTVSRSSRKYGISEKQIDEQVVAEAGTETAWGVPVYAPAVTREYALRLPAEVARRAELLARREGYTALEDWLIHVIGSVVQGTQTKPAPAISGSRRSASPVKKRSGPKK